MIDIGLDIGYSSVKVAWNGGKGMFPSVTGTPEKSKFKLYGGDSASITIPGDGTYLVGQDAVKQSRIIQRREDRRWIESNEYYRLMMYAFSLIPEFNEPAMVVTGLPVAFYDDMDKLQSLMIGEHTFKREGRQEQTVSIEKCKVIPQPFGTTLFYALDNDGNIADPVIATGTVGIIDCGGKTTNILLSEKIAEVTRKTTSVNVGGWDIVRAMRLRLEKDFPDSEFRDNDIMDIVMKRSLKAYGDKIDISYLVDEVINPMAQQIVAEATQLWNSGASIDKIIVTGGGSNMFGEYIKTHFKHAIIAEDPIYCNVLGYYKLASFVNKKG